jgi:hypothetical protein
LRADRQGTELFEHRDCLPAGRHPVHDAQIEWPMGGASRTRVWPAASP